MLEKNKETARRFVLGIVESKLPDELFAEDFAGWSALSGDIDGPVFRERRYAAQKPGQRHGVGPDPATPPSLRANYL